MNALMEEGAIVMNASDADRTSPRMDTVDFILFLYKQLAKCPASSCWTKREVN